MSNVLYIGNDPKSDAIKNTATAIVEIFKAGHENNIDQATIQAALDVFGKSSAINLTLTGNVTVGELRANVPLDTETRADMDAAMDEDQDESEGED